MKLSDLKSKINWKVLLVLLVIGWFFVIFTSIFGIALVGTSLIGLKNGATSLLDIITGGGSMSIPAEYKTVFDAASNPQANANHSAQQNWKIQPAFLAAIFYKENGKKWSPPPMDSLQWATSNMGAEGPFQFMPTTWNGYKQYARPNPKHPSGDPNVQDFYDAAFAAAEKLAMGGAAGNTTDEESLKRAAFAYNQDNSYVKDIMSLYHSFTGTFFANGALTNSFSQKIVNQALLYVNHSPKIRWGIDDSGNPSGTGSGPGVTNLKLDCSGFVSRIYREVGLIGQNDRFTTESIASRSDFTKIPVSQIHVGDIITSKSDRGPHMLIYAGGDPTDNDKGFQVYQSGGGTNASVNYDAKRKPRANQVYYHSKKITN